MEQIFNYILKQEDFEIKNKIDKRVCLLYNFGEVENELHFLCSNYRLVFNC